MAVSMTALVADLAAESADLTGMLAPLGARDWERPTPAPGWAIRDQVSHLAFFDEQATLAVMDPDRFAAAVADLETGDPDTGGGDFAGLVAEQYRHLAGTELLAWLTTARREYLGIFATLDPASRLPWFGPDMSAASSVTARLMETWAHGQDIADALRITRRATGRLRHVAHLGVATVGFSFTVHGQPAPDEPVRVELTGPDGAAWTWGPPDAGNVVRGTALDFCLVVTQRRHRLDTGLRAQGAVAEAWLGLAQAFAGPPGPGRAPARRDGRHP
jgi:uncharacterized protein (TIGR03084 family)